MERNRDYAKSFKRVNKVKERVKNCRLIFCLIRNKNSLQKQFITMELTIIVVMVYSTLELSIQNLTSLISPLQKNSKSATDTYLKNQQENIR